MKTMNNEERLENYYNELNFPKSVFVGEDDRLCGTWVMGNNYRVKSTYYGGYPHGYLKRIKALFPDKTKVLHLFGGKVDTDIIDGKTLDINPDMNPDYLCDAHIMSESISETFDLILADPPYSVEDCEHYGTSMVKRNTVLKECVKLLEDKGHLVWLDQVLPMYRKAELKTTGYIGMVKSTNHRFRVITIFEKQGDQ
tara:strand:+ start:4546 stop:5136 length:591 start_codon:yes stop_codon:yes gene_type:complete